MRYTFGFLYRLTSFIVLTRELHWAGWCLSGVSFCIFLNRPLSRETHFSHFFFVWKELIWKYKNSIIKNPHYHCSLVPLVYQFKIYTILSHFEAKYGTKWRLKLRENENEETTGWKKKSQSWTWSNIGRESDSNRRNWCKYYPICTFIFLNPPILHQFPISHFQMFHVF